MNMRSLFATIGLAALVLGGAIAGSAIASPAANNRLSKLLAEVQAGRITTEDTQGQPTSPGIFGWVTGWLLPPGTAQDGPPSSASGSADDTESATSVMPSDNTVTISRSSASAPNSFFKLQIGPGHNAQILQRGAGNTATVIQTE
jgi:hypothetical protein